MRVYNENNEEQQLPKGFANSCYKIVSPILLQKLINDFAVCKHYIVEYFYLLKISATDIETRTTYFKKEPHFLIGQPKTCRIFISCYIKSILLNRSGNQFILYKVHLEKFIFAKQR